MTIRTEKASDFPSIFEINQLAFGQTDESLLIERIRTDQSYLPALSFVAVKDKQVIGHILFSKIEIIGQQRHPSLALAPMAVHPDFQQQGIGSQLVRTGLEQARQIGFESVIVLGHKDYYPKFGFRKAANWNIQCPFEVPDEAFMAIELTKDTLANKAGVVQYSKAFGL